MSNITCIHNQLLSHFLLMTSTDAQILTGAISFTAKTYQDIGQMHAEQVSLVVGNDMNIVLVLLFIQGMSSLRSLIPFFRLLHLLETSAHASIIIIVLVRSTLHPIGHVAARPA